jgi:hypothetical protein
MRIIIKKKKKKGNRKNKCGKLFLSHDFLNGDLTLPMLNFIIRF